MDIEVVKKGENVFMQRMEVSFVVKHEGEGTPTRDTIREKLAAMFKSPKEGVIVAYMKSDFGSGSTAGYAKLYKSKDGALKTETKPILVRNKLIEVEKKEKKEVRKREKKEEVARGAGAKEERPASKKEETPPKADKEEAKKGEAAKGEKTSAAKEKEEVGKGEKAAAAKPETKK